MAGCLALDGQGSLPAVSVRDFRAKGDGITDDTAALQRSFTAACGGARRIHFSAGTYNISASLVTGCDLFIAGDGPASSIIFQTVHGSGVNGITSSYSLRLEDISINTRPVGTQEFMIAVHRRDDVAPAAGQNFTFLRFHSSGFNFGIDVAGSVITTAGVTTTELLGAVVVRDCNISVSTQAGAISQPVSVRTARSLTVEDNVLTGDDHNDHAIYAIAVRKVLIQRNTMRRHGNSVVKILTGGFGRDGHAHCDTGADYSSWVVKGNILTDSQFAMAFYTYCDTVLPALVISNNVVRNMDQVYEPDGASVYIEAACASVMQEVTMSGNVFQNLGLGGTLLLSSSQGDPCVHAAGRGTIRSFSSTDDRYVDWSRAHPGSYAAISARGGTPSHLLRATISNLSADGQGHERQALNLSAFRELRRR